jgi:hypothetical protein
MGGDKVKKKGEEAKGLGAVVKPAPRHQLDYRYWAKMPEWTVSEAAALSLGLDPRENHRNRRDYVDRLRLLERAVSAGSLDEEGSPPRSKFPRRIWSDWLRGEQIGLPPELKEAIRKMPVPRTKAAPDASANRVKELQEEVARLKIQLARERKSPRQQRYNNVLLVAYIAAVEGFGYDPNNKRSNLISDVLDAFAKRNIKGPQDDALRDIFDEARRAALERPMEGIIKAEDLP